MPDRGRFIVFEGLDGAGTTTQGELLAARLGRAGIRTHATHEPSSLPLGLVVRQAIQRTIHLDPEALALAFAADRLDHLAEIDRLVADGSWVVCDRYVLSSLAYQSADGVDFDWLREINREAHAPDATIYVDTPVATCLERIAARGESTEDRFHREDALVATAAAYRRAIDSGIALGTFLAVDGGRSPEEVSDLVWRGLADPLGLPAS